MTGTFLQFGIISLMAMSTLSVQEVKEPVIIPMDENPGVLIEKLSPLKLYKISWKIIQEWDLEPYFMRSEQLSSAWTILEKKCNQTQDCTEKERLKHLYSNLKNVTKDAASIESSLEGKSAAPKHRRKRDLSVLKFLFGTLSEQDRQELVNMIKSVAEDGQNLAKIMYNQTQFIKTEFKLVDEKAKKLDNLTQLFDQILEGILNQTELKSAVEFLAQSVNQYKLDTVELHNAVLFARQGTVHPRFLGFEKLDNSTLMAREKYPDAIFPSPNDIYGIADLAVIYSNRSLIYFLKIPLVTNENYTLTKASPVPVRVNATDATVFKLHPDLVYFGLHENLTTYVPISEKVFNKCKSLHGTSICQHFAPSRNISDKSPCEVQFSSGKKISNITSCKVESYNLKETVWFETSYVNTWIYATVDKENLQVECKHSLKPKYNMTIDGTGKLYVPAGCSAHTDDGFLPVAEEFTTVLDPEIFQQYEFNIEQMLKESEENRRLILEKLINRTQPESNSLFNSKQGRADWDDNSDRIHRLGKNSWVDGRFNTVEYAATSGFTGILIIIVVIVIIWKIKGKNGCSCVSKPQPTASTIVNISTEPKGDYSLNKFSKSQDLLIN